jgi:hypothetical protein
LKKIIDTLTPGVLLLLLAFFPGSPLMGQEPEGKTKTNKENPLIVSKRSV